MTHTHATLPWLILIPAHLVALAAAPAPFNYIGAILWVIGAVFLTLKPNERDIEVRQFQLYIFINLSLLIGYWLIGQLGNSATGGALAVALGVSPEAQDMTGAQLLSTMRFTILNLSFLSAVAYAVMAIKRLFWDRPGALFNERAPMTSAQSTLRRVGDARRGQPPPDDGASTGRR